MSGQRLQAALDGYAKFLQQKDLALPKHQPYRVRWVREFLLFAQGHGGYTFEQTLGMFLAEVGRRAGVEPWQIPPARIAPGSLVSAVCSAGGYRTPEMGLVVTRCPAKAETLWTRWPKSIRFRERETLRRASLAQGREMWGLDVGDMDWLAKTPGFANDATPRQGSQKCLLAKARPECDFR